METDKPFEKKDGSAFYNSEAAAASTTNVVGNVRNQMPMTNAPLLQQQQQPIRQSSRRVSKPPQIYSPEPLKTNQNSSGHTTISSNKSAIPKSTLSDDDEEGGDDDDLLPHPSYGFPKMVYTMLEETKNTDLLHWSQDGQAFYLNQNHSGTPKMLYKYFKLDKYISFHRQLNCYGWTKLQRGKHQGMMYNPLFHRGMDTANFDLITRKDSQRSVTKKVAKNKKEKMKVKKAGATTAKKKKEKSAKNKTIGKSKRPKITATVKKVPPGGGKKRKNPPTSSLIVATTTTTAAAAATITKKKSHTADKEDKKAKKRLTDYKKLRKLFGQWTMWNAPDNLDVYLENGKVEKVKKKKRKKALDYAITEDVERHKYSNTEISTLLCNEDITESVSGNQDKEHVLTDFVERIRKDKEQKDKLQELWSKNIFVPIAKGKILPPSKFKKPTNKWRSLNVGNRIGVYWRDDELYYNASINKQQENTSYFHLIYDDDGAEEWLDLSREDFKVLEEDLDNKFAATISNSRSGTNVFTVDQTSQKSNRIIAVQSRSITLPDDHSHLAPLLRYSWQGLGLGSKAGTPAYNTFVKERDPSANEVTALEILNDVRYIRNKGFSLPPQQFEIDSNFNDDGNRDQHILMNQLRSLQDEISKDDGETSSISKDYNDTLSTIRRLTDNWSIPTVKENLRTMETQIVKLNEREVEILKKCKQKGLLC